MAALVIGGLLSSIAGEVFLIDARAAGFPGVALGSELILAVERVIALFAAWLLVLIVVVKALAGELPTEVSGRGVRYADLGTAQHGLTDSDKAFRRLDTDVDALSEAVAALEDRQVEHAALLSRYAVEDGDHGH